MMDEMWQRARGRFPVGRFFVPGFRMERRVLPNHSDANPTLRGREGMQRAALRQAILSLRGWRSTDFEGADRTDRATRRTGYGYPGDQGVVRLRETFQSLTRERLKFETDVMAEPARFGTVAA